MLTGLSVWRGVFPCQGRSKAPFLIGGGVADGVLGNAPATQSRHSALAGLLSGHRY